MNEEHASTREERIEFVMAQQRAQRTGTLADLAEAIRLGARLEAKATAVDRHGEAGVWNRALGELEPAYAEAAEWFCTVEDFQVSVEVTRLPRLSGYDDDRI